MPNLKPEMKVIISIISIFFIGFLLLPILYLFVQSFRTEDGIGLSNYIQAIANDQLLEAILNSLKISTVTAILTTLLAFILAYTLHYTRIYQPVKRIIKVVILLPMLLPTITYGFAIMYSFGKQGLLTKIFGGELFPIYGFNGLLIGYVIYTLPPAFLLINNSFTYVDKKFLVVSQLMGDGSVRGFINTIFRPLIGTIGGAFVLSFILSFTDFGIPASVGGTYTVVATQLYQVMLGAIPDFNNGAVIAVIMLLPAVVGVLLMKYLERFHFHYDQVSKVELFENKVRDLVFGVMSMFVVVSIIGIFIVMFIIPFTTNYPYDLTFTFENIVETLQSGNLLEVFTNSLLVATLSALFGTVIAYCSALLNARSPMQRQSKRGIDAISMVTNTVPGMVLGLSYLLLFNNSDFKGTFTIIIIVNIVHFFTTPYLMAKNALSKMNPAWETTGELMGDSWIKTIKRVVLPNSASTVVEMFNYFFINSMVTISAVIFLVSTQTMVVTSKMKELQHYAKFVDIFVLSLLIFIANMIVKLTCDYLYKKTTQQ